MVSIARKAAAGASGSHEAGGTEVSSVSLVRGGNEAGLECQKRTPPFFYPDTIDISAKALGASKLRVRTAGADIELCWTCASCDAECPINAATGRLRPQSIVRMAAFGWTEELLAAADIWYCISCRRCSQICPNRVQPSRLIEHLQQKAVRQGRIPWRSYVRYRNWVLRFQHLRRSVISRCLAGESAAATGGGRSETLDSGGTIVPFPFKGLIEEARNAGTAACFSCRECSSACPIVSGRNVFDPAVLFRMVNLGMAEEVLSSPAIWMCLQCRRCTDACPQNVQGHRILRMLRERSIRRTRGGEQLPYRLERAHRRLYARWLEEVEDIVCR